MSTKSESDPLTFLLATHREAREVLDRALALLRSGGDAATTRELARRVVRFLGEVSPRHELDEEERIFPALRAYGPAADVAEAMLYVDEEHVAFDAIREAVALRWAHVGDAPECLPMLAPDLLRLTEKLALALRRHMEHEELVVYPLVRTHVPRSVLDAIAGVIAARDARGAEPEVHC